MDEEPIAVIEGPKGKAEIFESIVGTIMEYRVTCNGEARTFNNLGEAYLVAGEMAGKET